MLITQPRGRGLKLDYEQREKDCCLRKQTQTCVLSWKFLSGIVIANVVYLADVFDSLNGLD